MKENRLFEKHWRPLKDAKRVAKRHLYLNQGVWFASGIRTLFTFVVIASLYSWFQGLAFDQKMSDYQVHTTNTLDYLLTISCALVGRSMSDYLIDQYIYGHKTIPWKFYVYHAGKIAVKFSLGLIGMTLSVMLNTPTVVSILWGVVMILDYLSERWTAFGSRYLYLQTRKLRAKGNTTIPKTWQEWKQWSAYHWHFLGHDILNILTLGIYGVWEIPYKRATERYLLEDTQK